MSQARIENLLAQMTLEEKAGQLNQEPNSIEVDRTLVRRGLVGSVICANSAYAGNDRQARVMASALNELQRVAVEETRLGIPLLLARDVIHGHRAVAPIPLGQAATWNPRLVEEVAATAASEARADGIHWAFTPMIDIARDPRWGRMAEGFGEDPYLASSLAAAAINGYQRAGLDDPKGIVACAKHYVGYGAAEGGRDYNSGEITPHTLENIFLPPFHAAVKAGVATIMAAFLDIDGEPVTGSRRLLKGILRERWGWDGVIICDWGAVAELVKHGVAENLKEAAAMALRAGIDIDMAGQAYRAYLPELVREGALPVSLVDEAVRRVLRLKDACGLFDQPYTDESLATADLPASHRTQVRDMAQQSAVLLKNNGVLPLAKARKNYAVVGPLADPAVKEVWFGTWTIDGLATDMVAFLDAFRQALPDSGVWHALLPDDAVGMVRMCDAVVAVIGESNGRSGEDNAVTDIGLPPGQLDLLRALKRARKPIVAVVAAGRALAVTEVCELADAVLLAFHGGLESGPALADLLVGDAAPSGRLPVSLPVCTGQVPIPYNHKRTGRPVPLRGSRYLDADDQPLFPFGFGLGYTEFRFSATTAEIQGGTVVVRATVDNVGNQDGVAVAQLYIRDEVSSQTRPVRELRGFERFPLPAGESRVVEFSRTPEDLGFRDRDGSLVVEPGEFTFWISPDAASGVGVKLRVD